MLTKSLKRALLDSRWPMPPTFLLPWAAGLTTVSHSTAASNLPPPLVSGVSNISRQREALQQDQRAPPRASSGPLASLPELPAANATSSPPALSQSVRELLPVLQAQGPHYIVAHLYDRPYLLTQGDTLRLPFHMKDVEPGDILRLDRASIIGSRDYTLKAATAPPALNQSTGKVSYVDDRLFVCRAVVMGVESDPLHVEEKTKRRQRKVKRVKSKHRHTILRIKEVRVRGLEEVE
ncbi:hypothetical protein BAUCODRAFT_52000, partial [Baudoinia panamericana UAMH 10762]